MASGLEDGWMRFSSTMDSGAAGGAAPPSMCSHFTLMESLEGHGQDRHTEQKLASV